MSHNFQNLQFIDLNELQLPQQNARTHSPDQMFKLQASMKKFNAITPLLVDENYAIIAGTARYLAAKELGIKDLPVLQIFHLSEPEKRALALADNKISDQGGWDEEILKQELIFINESEISFEAPEIGFTDAEIDIIFSNASDQDQSDVEELPSPQANPVTCEGDIWVIGKHSLLCGTSLVATSYEGLMKDKRVAVIITDPPYNVPIKGFVGGKGKHKHREFAQASGELSPKEFRKWIKAFFKLAGSYLKDCGLFYVYIDWRSVDIFVGAGRKAIGDLLNIATWVKPNGGMGSFYRSRHEFCIIFRKGKGPFKNNIQLGRYGRTRTNVWEYAGMSSFGKNREEALSSHPTIKPTEMIADILLDCTKRGDCVLDPFAGSGTIFLAAEKTGRVAYGIELDPIYCDVAVRRWQNFTSQTAVLKETGETFAEVEARRRSSGKKAEGA